MNCLCVLAALSVLSDAHVLEVGNRSQGKQDLSPARNQQSWISKLKSLKQQPVGVSLQVFQPNYTSVTVGDTVLLECSYNSSKNSSQGRYKWFFTNSTSSSSSREIEVSNTNQKFNGRVFKSEDSTFTSQQETNMEIHNVRHDDTGTYVCEVELFKATNGKERGNGTRLLVLEAPHNQGLTIPLYWVSLYFSTTVVCRLLAAVVMTVSLRKRK